MLDSGGFQVLTQCQHIAEYLLNIRNMQMIMPKEQEIILERYFNILYVQFLMNTPIGTEVCNIRNETEVP